LNELRVGPRPIEPDLGVIADHSPDAIRVRTLADAEVEVSDREGRSWIGNADVALATLEDLTPTGNPPDVWERLLRA
jgi:hypothetical protein